MTLGIFDIFKIGIGPSSSHTFGPMKAAHIFVNYLSKNNILNKVCKLKLELYGSLALTKDGHGTGLAIKLGLEGYIPETLDPKNVKSIISTISKNKKINLLKQHVIDFSEDDFILNKEELPYHPNGMIFKAFDTNNKIIFEEQYYSVGGGFVEIGSQLNKNKNEEITLEKKPKHEFNTWKELLEICMKEKKEIWKVILENEKCFMSEKQINKRIKLIYSIMMEGISNSINNKEEFLEGGLKLRRRARNIDKKLQRRAKNDIILELVMLWGIASAEENASYGRVITAPTNGAAGVIPAVLKYYTEFYCIKFIDIKRFLLTAGAIGILIKLNASISGAEGGCQAEIGTACAMAAAGLTAVLGGTYLQCENAAIIALTHNLGLVCDPIGGFVQIPCIERNGINAVKAITAAKTAMLEKESNYLTLDNVILSMKDIGDDMPTQYRETALGGLAKHANKCCRLCKNCTMYC